VTQVDLWLARCADRKYRLFVSVVVVVVSIIAVISLYKPTAGYFIQNL
jgi:hypothetical protein